MDGRDIWVEAASEEMFALKLYVHLADISSEIVAMCEDVFRLKTHVY